MRDIDDIMASSDTGERIKKALDPKRIYAHDSSPGLGRGLRGIAGQTAGTAEAEWLALIERRVVIPVKWFIWGLTLIYWFTRQDLPDLPEIVLFGTYVAYFLANIGFTYLACISGIAPTQARAFSLISLTCDLAFISAAVYADSLQATPAFQQDFYIFLILLILRGLIVLRSAWENLFFGAVVTGMLLVETRWHSHTFGFLAQWEFTMRLGLVWIVFSIGWFLLESLQRQQRELLAIREQLVRQEDLAMLGEVSAGIAHEINNPIGIISACAEFIAPETADNSEVREEVETIQTEAKRCKRIVQELLDFASPEQSTRIDDCDLRQLCDDALARLPRDLESPPEVAKDYAPRLPLVRVDAHKMVQALTNALDNAARNRQGKTKIDIRIVEKYAARTKFVIAEIRDNGTGIAPGDLPHIFEPFYSRRPGGTGLGLAIARRILRAHRGDIQCESSVGAGTKMTFSLPALDEMAAPYPPEEPAAPPAA